MHAGSVEQYVALMVSPLVMQLSTAVFRAARSVNGSGGGLQS